MVDDAINQCAEYASCCVFHIVEVVHNRIFEIDHVIDYIIEAIMEPLAYRSEYSLDASPGP